MRVRNSLLIVGVLVIGMVATALPATATITGEEGCTPGYWKNHTDDWLEEPGVRSYDTDDVFGDVFGVAYDVTLIDALQGGGGRGIAGAHKILARAATAAIINAASEDLGYPLRRADDLFPAVQAVWGGSRHEILSLARYLDGLNNLGTDDFCL